MTTVLTYCVTLIFIGITVFVTLFFKNELERMFREETKVFVFHLFNILITATVAFGSHAVMTIYLFGNEFHLRDGLILIALTFSTYLLGHAAFEKYNFIYRKYSATDKGKILVLNDKYLKKKKRFKNLKHYNSK